MDGLAQHGLKNPYSVMLLSKDGGATEYQKYEGKKTYSDHDDKRAAPGRRTASPEALEIMVGVRECR